jgi:hypothetical protein
MRWFLRVLTVWLVLQPALLFADTPDTPVTPEESVTVPDVVPLSETTQSAVETLESEVAAAAEGSEIASDEVVTTVTAEDEVDQVAPPETPDSVANDTIQTEVERTSATSAGDGTRAEPVENQLVDDTAVTDEMSDDAPVRATTSAGIVAGAASSTAGAPAQSDAALPEVPSSTDASSDTATSSPEAGTEVTTEADGTETAPSAAPTHTVTTNDTYFQFSQDECVRVADGSFYCGASTAEAPTEERFFVALDADGDREIFLQHEDETVQITHNRYDDAAPYYDAISNTLVWHALIAGRYQIMSYDFTNDETKQLTDDTANSMEPTRYGSITAWQQWGESSWDIVVSDGVETVRITNDAVSDIAPSVHDGIIIWKRVFDSGQRIAMYDVAGKRMLDIAEGDASASVKNARMMLVFESVQANGDRVVHGFDPVTRQLVPLDVAPVHIPEELPDSEPTDEVRALVQAKPVIEEEVLEQAPTNRTSASSSTTTASSSQSAIASSTLDLVIPAASTTIATPATTTTATTSSDGGVVSLLDDSATSSYDLVIPPVAATTSDEVRYDG